MIRAAYTCSDKQLATSFFARSTVTVARDLLGRRLVRCHGDGRMTEGMITETEAYDGFEDRASHAHRGMTRRNAVMFGPPGVIYLYLCYGVHWLLNITTREEGYPTAVLIRGMEGVSGPGRLTKHLELSGEENTLPLGRTAGLWVAAGNPVPEASVARSARVGVDYAGPEWSRMPWRFQVSGGGGAG
ncbi:MAG: DNA-3-methyladenine glycosylase [Verrucomicrobia bacterium]|nr:DNA-3-methyladenine glycosylase [Verrucomicrobiota bacterium]